ncbi:vitellogenin-2-like isoform X2 [Neocloeon triangulifer]|uniref:vitellogenin-2-like isoform X2 n=1 Tax=Neocloeon triangulifer TaxID=2078957 RepID=UPI00286F2136|nr:vitellogenin-2-like isoform X2 [Neocloeon triangulifer]
MQIVGLFVGLLAALAVAENGWRVKQEYVYAIEGRSVAGIPQLKHQYAGMHFRGNLRIQNQHAAVVVMKLKNMTFTKIHANMGKGWWHPIPNTEEELSRFQELPDSGEPFIARFEQGKIVRLVVSSRMPTWEVNFIQSIISHLQQNLGEQSGSKFRASKSDLQADDSMFNVMEDSIVGRCEVMYEFSPLAKTLVNRDNPQWFKICGKTREFVEVTKTWNYTNCEHLAQSNYGVPNIKNCVPGGNQCGNLWKRSSLTRVVGCGDKRDMIRLNTVSSSKILSSLRLQPEDDDKSRPNSQATVGSYLNLTLVSVQPYSVDKRILPPKNPVALEGIKYQYDFDFAADDQPNPRKTRSIKRKKKHPSRPAEDTTDSQEDDQDKNSEPSSNKSEEKQQKKKGKDSKKKTTTTTESPESQSLEWSTFRTPTSEESTEDVQKKSKKSKRPKHDSSSSDENNDDNDENSNMDQPPVLPFSPFAVAHQDDKARACLVQQFKEVVQEVTRALGPQSSELENIENIQLTVQMCRSMTYTDLSTAVNTVIEDRSDKIALETKRKILRDIVLMCGTNPSFLLIKNWIETGVYTGEEAAQIIAAIPSYLLKPSPKLLQKFFEMIRSDLGSHEEKVKIAAVIAFSHLLRATCTQQQNKLSHDSMCKPQVSTYLSFLNEKAKTAKNLKTVYITAIGNTGLPEALQLLASFARDIKASTYQRATAIVAMRHLSATNPQETSRALLKIFHTTTNPNSVRVAAVSMLLYSQIPLSTWQRIAISTWYDPSMSVNTYIYSSLRSIATIKDPVYKTMAENAAAVLPLAKTIPLGPYRPYNFIRASVAKDLTEIVSEQLSWNLDPMASNFYYRDIYRISGVSKLHFESDLWLADLDGMLTLIKKHLYQEKKDYSDVRPAIPNLPTSTHWIRSALNIAERTLPKIEGHFSFKLGSVHQRFFPIDDKSAGQILDAAKKYIDEYKFGQEMLYQKNGHSTFWISTVTEIGFPAEFKIDIPWMLRVKSLTNSYQSRGVFATQIKAIFSTKMSSELSVFTPNNAIRYVAGTTSFTTVQIPEMNVAIQKLPGLRMNISLVPMYPEPEALLFAQKSTPYTAQQDMLNLAPFSSIHGLAKIEIAPELKSKPVAGNTDSFRLEYSSEAPNHRWAPEPHWFLSYPSLWRGLESSELKIWANRPSPVSAVFSMRQAKLENGEITFLNSTIGKPSRSRTTEPTSTEAAPTTEYMTTPSTVYTTSTSWSNSTTTEANLSESDEQMQPENYTKMERLDRIKLRILSANVDDPIGSFNASQINLFQQGNFSTRQEYLLTNILSAMESGQATVFSASFAVNHSDVPQYQTFFTVGHGRAQEYHRMGAFYIDDVEKYQAAISGVLSTPRVPLLKLKSMLEAKINSTVMADLRINNDNNIDDIISLKGIVTRTEDQKNYIYNHTNSRECLKSGSLVQPECYRLLQKAAFLDRYNLSISYNEGARRHGLSAQHYLTLAKHILFPHMLGEEYSPDVILADAAEKQIKVIAEVHPESQSASLWMRTPTEEIEYNSIPINSLLHHTMRINPVMGLASRLQDASYCSMEQRKFVTYDRSRFDYKLTNSWHVLTKDCSGRSRFAMIARNITNHTELLVNVDNYKIIHFMPGSVLVDGIRVDLNKAQVAENYDLAGNQIVELTYTSERAFKLRLPAHGLTVIYDPSAILIQPSALLRGRLCGICGNYNGQMEDDFSVPSGAIKQDANDFAKSWALQLR